MYLSSTTKPDARDLLRAVLEDQGAKVTSFASAEAALAALQDHPADGPGLRCGHAEDGRLSADPHTARGRGEESAIPALALTAFARAEDRKRSLVAGYQAHLAKPFDVGELILMIADLMGR